jgi:hypothetical protein
MSRNKVVVPARQATQPGGIGSLELILGPLKSLKIRAQGVTKRCRLSWLTNSAHVYEPDAGGGVSCGVSVGDLTPHLTYDLEYAALHFIR